MAPRAAQKFTPITQQLRRRKVPKDQTRDLEIPVEKAVQPCTRKSSGPENSTNDCHAREKEFQRHCTYYLPPTHGAARMKLLCTILSKAGTNLLWGCSSDIAHLSSLISPFPGVIEHPLCISKINRPHALYCGQNYDISFPNVWMVVGMNSAIQHGVLMSW